MLEEVDPLDRISPSGTRWTEEERETIARGALAAIANGTSVTKFCEAHPLKPLPATVFIWFTKYPHFRVAYIAARMLAADVMIDKVLDLADDKGADPKRSKLQIDVRFKLAAHFAPEKYGDRLDITSAGRALGDIPQGASPEERIDHILRRIRGEPTPPRPAIIDARVERADEEKTWSVFD